MKDIRNNIIIFFMEFLNQLYDFYFNSFETVKNIYKMYDNYLKGYTTKWLFFEDNYIPLPYTYVYSRNTDEYKWCYDESTHILQYTDTKSLERVKLPWLSVNLCVTKNNDHHIITKSLDQFIHKLKIYSDGKHIPDLKLILSIWSLHSKHWYISKDIIELHIIDEMADHHIINVNNMKHQVSLINNKISIENNKTE